jgi:hypothetical protein
MGKGRLFLAAGFAIGVAACGHDGPEDPAVAVPGEGIPMGAANAGGVAFDAPSGLPVTPHAHGAPGHKGKPPPPVADPDDDAPDPFADPLATPPSGGGTGTPKPGSPHHHPKPSKGTDI